MTAVADIKISLTLKSKISEIDFNNLPFGKNFTDHMLVADYENGEWKSVEIKPYQSLSIAPSLAAIHYGQSIFEGIKAYKNADGEINIFRPLENFKRFNISAERMAMPLIPEEIFIEGMKQLIDIDKNWVPSKPEYSLYIRPFMFATDEMIGVKPSSKFKFIIILSPTGPYHSAPTKIFVEEKYTRAAPGGVGFSKNAGNYGGSLLASKKANAEGFDQVLWTDSVEHKWLQEVGMMNVFFIINNTLITPDLSSGTILAGVTRDSVITIFKEMGLKVEERSINIDEVINAYKVGTLTEVFGTGTAATISFIKALKYRDELMEFDESKWKLATEVKRKMEAIKYGVEPDIHGWLVKV